MYQCANHVVHWLHLWHQLARRAGGVTSRQLNLRAASRPFCSILRSGGVGACSRRGVRCGLTQCAAFS
ncbi:unnamed protein product [Spodoptera exigua]|nr:unnamed protein product [Spodoptera exigua]